MTRNDVQLNYLPLFHVFAIGVVVFGVVLTGGRQVLMETFDPDEALRLIESERVTMTHGFDTHFRDLMEAKKRRNGPVDLSSLRTGLFAAGADSSIAIAVATQTEICPTQSAFGMTEVWATASIGFPDSTEDQRIRASGYPLPGVEIRVIDPQSGRDVPIGTQGEILVRGYSLMKGYWDDPAATARTIDSEGWLHTGDAGLMRPDGYLRFTGRYKDMLKVGGENVSPAEIEELLMQVPGVAQIAVVGAPDARLSEIVVAFVVRDDGANVTEGELIESCRGKIASYKIPRRVLFVGDLPMTASGKVQKEKLRQSLKASA
jgi:fatty-acyl-CoA synthase